MSAVEYSLESFVDTTPRPLESSRLDRLRAMILMGGSVRPTRFSTAIQRAIMDLPADRGHRIMDLWRKELTGVLDDAGIDQLPLRVLVNRTSHKPDVGRPDGRVLVSVEEDPSDFRGKGGVLRDVCEEYDEDDYILTANAGQVLVEPLKYLVGEMVDMNADVVLIGHRDGTPSGIMLIRCGCLKLVPHNGFIDMKEQALPVIAEHHVAKVVQKDIATGVPTRTLSDYITALRRHHLHVKGESLETNPFLEEDWRPVFGVLEDDTAMAPDAKFHDSVVLKGGRVENGAILVRSVVCPGATAKSGKRYVDKLVTAAGPVRG